MNSVKKAWYDHKSKTKVSDRESFFAGARLVNDEVLKNIAERDAQAMVETLSKFKFELNKN